MHQPLFSIWRSYCYLLSLQTYFLCTHLNLLNFCLSQFNLALPASYYAVLTTPWSSSSCLCTNNPGLGLSCVCANTHSLWDLMLYAQHFWSLEGHAVCTNTQGLWNPMLYALSPMAFGTSHWMHNHSLQDLTLNARSWSVGPHVNALSWSVGPITECSITVRWTPLHAQHPWSSDPSSMLMRGPLDRMQHLISFGRRTINFCSSCWLNFCSVVGPYFTLTILFKLVLWS